jgi:hypothetical protein
MSTRTADLAYLDNTSDDPTQRAPLVLGGRSFGDVTDAVCGIVENPRTPPMWYVFFAASLGLLGVLGAMIAYLIFTGVGVWGLQPRSAGAGPSSTSCSGSVSATPAR